MKINEKYISRTKIKALRADTLNNNLLWLESFGCNIRYYDHMIYIHHPELHEYVAVLILEPSEETLERLKVVLTEVRQVPAPPAVYLDEAVSSRPFHSALTANQFKPIYLNLTMAGVLPHKPTSTDMILQPAGLDDIEQWSSLYSKGYCRSGRDAEIDQSRWLKSFERGSSVRHWFFVMGKRTIGVCQTCIGRNVIGIYSFTIIPSERGISNILGALRALQTKLSKGESEEVYFDVLIKEAALTKRPIIKPPPGFMIIRRMKGYCRIN